MLAKNEDNVTVCLDKNPGQIFRIIVSLLTKMGELLSML